MSKIYCNDCRKLIETQPGSNTYGWNGNKECQHCHKIPSGIHVKGD